MTTPMVHFFVFLSIYSKNIYYETFIEQYF